MTAVAAVKRVGSGFSNEKELVRVIWDFAVDGGAIGSLDLCTALSDCVISDFMAVVKTTCTSAGAATLAAGQTSDDDCFRTAEAVAGLVAGTVFQENGAFDSKMKLASGDKLTQKIAAFALTAGKIEYTFEVMKI